MDKHAVFVDVQNVYSAVHRESKLMAASLIQLANRYVPIPRSTLDTVNRNVDGF